MHLYFCHLELFPLKLANWKLVLKDIGHSYFPVKDCDKHWRCFYRKNRIIRWSQILLSSFSRNSWIELWKCSLHIVYILKIKMTWSLTKLWHSDQRFIKNILTPLLLKICLKYLRMCILQLLINMLFTSFWIWQQLNTPALWILMNIWAYRWCHECVYMTFSCKYVLVCNFLLKMLTSIHAMLLSSMGNLSNVSIKLKFRRNKFGRRTVCTE